MNALIYIFCLFSLNNGLKDKYLNQQAILYIDEEKEAQT